MIKNLDHKYASDSNTTCPSYYRKAETDFQQQRSRKCWKITQRKVYAEDTERDLLNLEFNFDYLKNRSDANQVRHTGKTVGNSSKTVEEERSLCLRRRLTQPHWIYSYVKERGMSGRNSRKAVDYIFWKWLSF